MPPQRTFFDEAKGVDVFAPEGREFIPGTQQLKPLQSAGAYDALQVPSSLDFAKQVQAPITQITQSLVKAMQNRAKPLDIFNQFEQAAGLPGQRKVASTLQRQIFGLEDALKRVEPTVAGTTRESMVTQAQRERLIQAQSEPLREDLGTFSTNLGRLEGAIAKTEATLAQKLGLVLQGQEMDLEPFKIQLEAQQDSAARLQTGFSDDKQTFLDIALQKIQRGQQLEDQEREQAFQILQAETNYENELNSMREQSRLNLENALSQLQEGSRLNIQETKDLLPISLDEYRKKLELDKQFAPPKSGGGGTLFERLLGGLNPEQRQKAIDVELGIDGSSATVQQVLNESRGEDGFVNPGVYSDLRIQAKISPTEFDSRFGQLVNPRNKGNLGISGFKDDATQFLDKDFFKNNFNQDQLQEQAGKGFFGIGKGNVDEYLDNTMKTVNLWRNAGMTDEQIFKQMQE